MTRGSSVASFVGAVAMAGCHQARPVDASPQAEPNVLAAAPTVAAPNPIATAAPLEPAPPAPLASEPQFRGGVAVACSPADWSPRQLKALLAPGRIKNAAQPDLQGVPNEPLFMSECTDSPEGASGNLPAQVTLDGVGIKLVAATPADKSGRDWAGAQCSFEVWSSNTTSKTARLEEREIPPFNTINSVLRSGSAVWLSVGFNGYTREFPKGGNRIIAVDLCQGRVVWQSKDATSNGGLLLLGDYLIAPFGFTNERRFVYVLDAHSGSVVQKLPILENVCPSKSWAPNWHAGERCDAPGQLVGAANSPRVEQGLLFVDTNTGSATFQLK
jgi:hypothetical protein